MSTASRPSTAFSTGNSATRSPRLRVTFSLLVTSLTMTDYRRAESPRAETGDSLVYSLVGCGERDAHVLGPGRAVERARRDPDSAPGARRHGLPAVLSARRPEVQTGPRPVDPEPGCGARPHERVAAAAVQLLLRRDVLLVAERRDHRGLHGGRRHETEVLAHREQLAHELTASGHESGAVAGEVRLLRERVHREREASRALGHLGVQDAGSGLVGAPVELGVALVVRDHRAELSRALHGAP